MPTVMKFKPFPTALAFGFLASDSGFAIRIPHSQPALDGIRSMTPSLRHSNTPLLSGNLPTGKSAGFG